MIGISILGSTGSIGVSTLDVIARHPQRYRVTALTANTDVEGMRRQCLQHQPQIAAMADPASAEKLARQLKQPAPHIQVIAGAEGLQAAATHTDTDSVMAAIVGAAGLSPTLAAIRAGKRILLANKESLVMAGQFFMAEVERCHATVSPIDSEHNAIFQCLPPNYADGLDQVGVERILLTASGGPFRHWPMEKLQSATPEQACAHPNWVMGRKISVDSATLMNKGLEVIEAHWLFNAPPERIEVVVHPESIIHSLVAYHDGSMLAQLGNPDMRTPIAHALAWPERHHSGVNMLDLPTIAQLNFERPDTDRFPCLRLAFEAIQTGGSAPAILNAANEIAVAAFLESKIRFTQIPEIIENTLAQTPSGGVETLSDLFAIDRTARHYAQRHIKAHNSWTY
jgi:1-deoxy-D-xylulose-5-phosphate reductoisomerase